MCDACISFVYVWICSNNISDNGEAWEYSPLKSLECTPVHNYSIVGGIIPLYTEIAVSVWPLYWLKLDTVGLRQEIDSWMITSRFQKCFLSGNIKSMSCSYQHSLVARRHFSVFLTSYSIVCLPLKQSFILVKGLAIWELCHARDTKEKRPQELLLVIPLTYVKHGPVLLSFKLPQILLCFFDICYTWWRALSS